MFKNHTGWGGGGLDTPSPNTHMQTYTHLECAGYIYPEGFTDGAAGSPTPPPIPALLPLPDNFLRFFLSPVKECTTASSSSDPGGIGEVMMPPPDWCDPAAEGQG